MKVQATTSGKEKITLVVMFELSIVMQQICNLFPTCRVCMCVIRSGLFRAEGDKPDLSQERENDYEIE